MPEVGVGRVQRRVELVGPLESLLGVWLGEVGAVEVPFPAPAPFAGINTEAEWRQRESEGV